MIQRCRPGPTRGRIIAWVFVWMLSSFLSAEPETWATELEEFAVTQIAIDPIDLRTLYALTTYSVGVLKSTDEGASWSQINQGIKSYSLYDLKTHPRNPKVLYLGAGGAGLYKSTDAGATWVQMNDGLQNTDIGTLVLHPKDPETVYVVTSTGLFKSPDGGKSWIALNQGDDFTESQQFQSLIVLPTSPPAFYLASKKGLYTRKEGDAGWVPVGGPFKDKQISALAHDPRTGKLYAAVFRRGTISETLREGALFVSDDEGKNWSQLGKGLEQDWIRVILIDKSDPRTLYLATIGRGVLKSTDGGENWKEINVGLTDPDRAIRSLVMDRRDSKILYAGSNGHWIFRSQDAGATWKLLPIGPHQRAGEILASLVREDERVRKASATAAPAAFDKCNRCHGWTDSNLNSHNGTWRVAANRRDWAMSVKRMSKGASLTPVEEAQITGFLNTYTQGKRSAE